MTHRPGPGDTSTAAAVGVSGELLGPDASDAQERYASSVIRAIAATADYNFERDVKDRTAAIERVSHSRERSRNVTEERYFADIAFDLRAELDALKWLKPHIDKYFDSDGDTAMTAGAATGTVHGPDLYAFLLFHLPLLHRGSGDSNVREPGGRRLGIDSAESKVAADSPFGAVKPNDRELDEFFELAIRGAGIAKLSKTESKEQLRARGVRVFSVIKSLADAGIAQSWEDRYRLRHFFRQPSRFDALAYAEYLISMQAFVTTEIKTIEDTTKPSEREAKQGPTHMLAERLYRLIAGSGLPGNNKGKEPTSGDIQPSHESMMLSFNQARKGAAATLEKSRYPGETNDQLLAREQRVFRIAVDISNVKWDNKDTAGFINSLVPESFRFPDTDWPEWERAVRPAIAPQVLEGGWEAPVNEIAAVILYEHIRKEGLPADRDRATGRDVFVAAATGGMRQDEFPVGPSADSDERVRVEWVMRAIDQLGSAPGSTVDDFSLEALLKPIRVAISEAKSTALKLHHAKAGWATEALSPWIQEELKRSMDPRTEKGMSARRIVQRRLFLRVAREGSPYKPEAKSVFGTKKDYTLTGDEAGTNSDALEILDNALTRALVVPTADSSARANVEHHVRRETVRVLDEIRKWRQQHYYDYDRHVSDTRAAAAVASTAYRSYNPVVLLDRLTRGGSPQDQKQSIDVITTELRLAALLSLRPWIPRGEYAVAGTDTAAELFGKIAQFGFPSSGATDRDPFVVMAP